MTLDLAPSLRIRKKLATRQAIHEAAFELVDHHGLSGVTVEAISDRAGVAPRTFWAYFSSKEEAVLDHDPARPEALRAALVSRPESEDVLTALKMVLVDDLASRAADREGAVRRAQLVRREPQLMSAVAAEFDAVERALTVAVAERLGQDPDADILPGVIVSAGCGACRVAFKRWTELKARPELAGLIDEGFAHLTRGLAPRMLAKPVR